MDDRDHEETTRRSFEQQVSLFADPESPFATREQTALSWVEPLSADMVVLDVACGAAHVAEQLAPLVHQVVGVDLTRALLELGARRLRDAGVRNVLLQEGSASALPFADDQLDLVVCRSSLHHFPDVAGAIREMARVCRPGGRVAVVDLVPPGDAVRERYDQVHRLLDPSHVAVLSDVEIVEILGSEVGPITYVQRMEPMTLPLELVLSDAADHDAVRTALAEELEGGTVTGFEPSLDGDQLDVTFHTLVVHAAKGRGDDG